MQALLSEIAAVPTCEVYGRVRSVQGLLVEIAGPINAMSVGSRLRLASGLRGEIVCEVVGFRNGRALALPFGPLEGVRMGAKAVLEPAVPAVKPSGAWLGRIVNALGEPIDGKGPLVLGPRKYPLRACPPPAHQRERVGGPVDLGVRALNSFVTCCKGQRMGIFAGSGVGKSVLLSMLARFTRCDISVIGLIGERGREVQEFIEDNLGEEGMARSVLVVATSDEAALMRRQAAYLTMTLSEYFRDQGTEVLCMIDSVTRFAMAQREIGLAGGEPPTTKGYTPTVFTELPRLLERAGPGTGRGSITGLFTVLVEGDDHNEPIADAVRSILDGHIVMERAIAERGRYPAINVLKSVSRTMPDCLSGEQEELVRRARQLMSTYSEMEELIRLGAYRAGSNPEVDEAIAYHPMLEEFLNQAKADQASLEGGYGELARILNGESLQDEALHAELQSEHSEGTES
ncbi:MAG: flagellar protein export ATPase FliI [Hyphomicrobiaceae bacterium]|nr:flagellar protein export ATPase FliI [Hyphomicrobiaceae bacterium]